VTTLTVGEALVNLLEQAGVENVFGIPGVHTVELYRGLDQSAIRHITPRHEQGAAFMADGYARVSSKPGVCLLITGPGLTNAATGVAQARADSIPMLVISSANRSDSLGKHQGHLHELPDQAAFADTLFLESFRVLDPANLGTTFNAAMARMTQGRPGPVHLDIPTDVLKMKLEQPRFQSPDISPVRASRAEIKEAAALCNASSAPVVILGGGATAGKSQTYINLAQQLDAPTITTTNARGLLNNHPLNVPASPSLAPVRDLISNADLLLTVGSEIGPTDFDMYQRGEMPPHPNMIRVDIDPTQFPKRTDQGLMITGDATSFAEDLIKLIAQKQCHGANRAERTLKAVSSSLSVCIIGDGGLQFTMSELGTARDTNANTVFLVWNNGGYREIETSMTAAGVSPVGVTPTPPDFIKVAEAYDLPAIQARSKRSSSITLVQAATKSATNFSFESDWP